MKTDKKTFASLLLGGILLNSCNAPQQNPSATPDDANGGISALYDNGKTRRSPHHPSEEEWAKDGHFTHSNKKGTTYHHKNYSLSYSEEDEQSEWVAYELTRNESHGDEERAELFTEDPDITTGSAHPYEYRNSGYDKGHLAPSGDMRFDTEAMNECFYMSNISPQVKEMNCGIWNDLEKQTRKWARFYGRIHIVCGPVLNHPKTTRKRLCYDDKYKGRTKSNITIPDLFYKIIFDFSKKGKEKMIAFCIPNKNVEDSFDKYVVTVDSIEELTGIDFFSNLPTEVQKRFESSSDLEKWK